MRSIAIRAWAAVVLVLAVVVAAHPGPLPGEVAYVRWLQDRGELLATIADLVRLTTGTEGTLIAAALPAGWLIRRHGRPAARAVLIVLFATLVVQPLFKEIVDRPRPDADQVEVRADHTSKSFPSGHSLSTTAVWGTAAGLAWRHRRRFLAAAASTPIVLTGVASGVQGVHWPSDAVAGTLVGALAARQAVLALGDARDAPQSRRAGTVRGEAVPGVEMDVNGVLDDLVAEQGALDAVVAVLTPEQWATSTPSPRWTITDQIGHLTYFDTTAALAITDPEAFAAHRGELLGQLADEHAADEYTLGAFRERIPTEQLAEWRRRRDELEAAGRTLTDDTRIEWYGPSMGAKSFLTARLMEVWAHGQDVCDAIGATRTPTDRLRHVAQLGVITRGWSYVVRGEVPPEGDVRVELTAPSGDIWSWGPPDATSSVRGPAEDFCLVVTQRRHVDDTALVVVGELARDWMTKAQAFAGGPTTGPDPKGTD